VRTLPLLALFLFPARLTAQDPQEAQPPAAATEQPPAAPELADLIPLATALSGRLASLEKTISDKEDLSQVEQQLREIDALVDEHDKQFLALKASTDQRAGRLLQFKAEIKSAGETLAEVGTAVTEQVRTLGNLRKAWLTEQQQWVAWQATTLKNESLTAITTTVARAQGVIDTALGLLQHQLEPLLVMQEQVGALQTRINTLTDEVEGLISLAHGGVAGGGSPAMLSAQYFSQLAPALRESVHTGLGQIVWPGKEFVARQAWVGILQGVLSLMLALVFVRHRRQLEQVEHWQFIAKRPIAAGILVGVMSAVVFAESPSNVARLAMAVVIGGAFVRLMEGLVERGWRRRLMYGVAILLIVVNLCYVLDMPLALFRVYILVAALVSLLCCLRWVAESRRLGEAWRYAWGLRLAAVLFAAVAFTELRGEAKLAEFLFVASLRTLGIVLVFGLLRHIMRGVLEWAVLSSASRGVALVGSNLTVVIQRLALLLDALIGVVLLSALLMTWQVYDGPAEAITGLLSIQATIGAQTITVGLVILAVGSLGVSYLASWLFQTLLTENVLARRHVETGVSIAVSRLLHYALVTVGFVVALVVLGVDLTKMTLLVSALGVGIGFGLQTIVNNFVCGLILLFERPLRVGDIIELSGQWVKIVKIGLRSTQVRTRDRADMIVPNTDLITNQVTNWTLTSRQAERMIKVGVAYGSDVALVMRTLKECALAHPGVVKSPEPRVLFQNFGDSSLDFELEVVIVIADVDDNEQIESDLRQEIDRRFRQAGIEIPFPQRDLHVRSVENTNDATAAVSTLPARSAFSAPLEHVKNE
jgi:small-conductance mechanosensitive channel